MSDYTDDTSSPSDPDAPDATGAAGAFNGPEWAGRSALSTPGTGRTRMSSRRIARRRMQRRTGWLLIGLGGLMVLTAAWLMVTGLLARNQLDAMKSDLAQLRADISTGNTADAKIVAGDLSKHAARAHSETTGPAWWIVSAIPGVGDPFRTARGISATADSLGATTVPQLIQVSSAIDPAQFKVTDRTIDIASLVQVTPQLNSAVVEAHKEAQKINSLPNHTWLGSVNSGANEVASSLNNLVGSLDTVDQVAKAAPTMLGYTTPQRYFVAFQNEAELRGTGGLPGAFGIVVADHGKLTFTHFGTDGELEGINSNLDFGPDYDQDWQGFEPTLQYLNSDVDPDFHYAAEIWASLWQQKSGEQVNGAISLDPTALGYLLAVTGPATLPDGTQITAQNIVTLTQSTAYTKFSDNNARKTYLLQVAQAADQKVLSGAANSKGLFDAARQAANERRLLIWDADTSVESLLSSSSLGGTIAATSAPYVAPIIINYGANKLDYYLKANVIWVSSGCDATRDVTVTITLENTAPAGLPAYVTNRDDQPPYPVASGDQRVMLYYIGTNAGVLNQITINGQAETVDAGMDGQHPTYSTLIELPRGKTQTIVMHLQEPGSAAKPVVLRQPMVNPITVSARTANCS